MGHFFNLNVGFNQIKLDKVKLLLMSNIVAWFLCFLYLQFETLDADAKTNFDFFFENTENVTQIALSVGVNYILMLLSYRSKLA